jgi:hypothetical protein
MIRLGPPLPVALVICASAQRPGRAGHQQAVLRGHEIAIAGEVGRDADLSGCHALRDIQSEPLAPMQRHVDVAGGLQPPQPRLGEDLVDQDQARVGRGVREQLLVRVRTVGAAVVFQHEQRPGIGARRRKRIEERADGAERILARRRRIEVERRQEDRGIARQSEVGTRLIPCDIERRHRQRPPSAPACRSRVR